MSRPDLYVDDDKDTYGPSINTHANWIPKLFEANYQTTQLVFSQKNGKTVTCLRQPRDLYAISKFDPLATPRCIENSKMLKTSSRPIECQISPERPLHILYTPKNPEPLHKRGKEVSPPHTSSDIFGRVVYDNSPDPEIKYFVSSKADSKMTNIPPYLKLKDENDKSLLFESRFESGNLMRAIKVGEYDYQLWLAFDTYTKKHTQWYYFQIKNARKNVTYRFTIMNFLKSGSLYNEGMKPLLYSEKDSQEKGIGWVRVGSNITYYKNDIKVEENKERCYYSLYWTCTFPNENDTYYFAHSYPYTYSDLQEYLTYLGSDSQRRKVCKQRVLCQTLAGNHVYLLTITAPSRCPKQAKLKKAIVITARIHPGETIASWLMKGFLDFITSSEPDAKILRDTFIFKVIPMLNPDGVIVGNYRCSLSGRDLNRNYRTVLKDSFPPVWSTRYLIKRLQDEREVVMYCDFHGHSKKKNIFIYGCENKQDVFKRFHSRIFPLMMAKNIPDLFSFNGCRFRIQKSKEGTGRVVMWNLGIKYSYTMEASFCGSSLADNKDYHFNVQDYEAMGYHFCDTLLDFFDPDTTKFNTLLLEIQERVQADYMKKMLARGELDVNDIDFYKLEYISELESESCGSDSSVSDGLPMQLLHASIPEISKKKRLKTRNERNKNRKKQERHMRKFTSARETKIKPLGTSSREVSPVKAVKTGTYSPKLGDKTKLTYSSNDRMKSSVKCLTPSRVTSTYEYLDSHSYVQAGCLSDSSPFGNGSSSCERCYPSYYLSFEASDGEAESHRYDNASYSLFETRVPTQTEVSPTMELARRLTAYNHPTAKAPPQMNKMFPLWTSENFKRDELLKRRTLNQGDNVEYLRKRLANIHSTEAVNTTSFLPSDLFEKVTSGAKPLTTHDAAGLFFSKQRALSTNQDTATSPPRSQNIKIPGRKKYLPRLQKKENLFREQSSHFHLPEQSLDVRLDDKTYSFKQEPLTSNSATWIDDVKDLRRQNRFLTSAHNAISTETEPKPNMLKERLVSFGGFGLLAHSDIEMKMTDAIDADTSAEELPTIVLSETLLTTSTPQAVDTPHKRVLTSQQYRIFKEDERSCQDPTIHIE